MHSTPALISLTNGFCQVLAELRIPGWLIHDNYKMHAPYTSHIADVSFTDIYGKYTFRSRLNSTPALIHDLIYGVALVKVKGGSELGVYTQNIALAGRFCISVKASTIPGFSA
jgi:hypothetical protein